MNVMKTGMLLAALTALFMGVGYLVGGSGRRVHRLPLRGRHEPLQLLERRQDGAAHAPRARGRRARPRRSSSTLVARARRARRPADAEGLRHRQPAAERLRHRPQPGRMPRSPRRPGCCSQLSREEIAGVMAHELAHVKNRDTLTMTITATIAGAISMLANFAFFFGGNREQQSARHRRRDPRGDHRADRGHAGADGDQPDARIFRRPRRRGDLPAIRCALASALAKIAGAAQRAADDERGAQSRDGAHCSSSTR